MKTTGITVDVTAKIKWQEVYEDLLIKRDLIDAQLIELIKVPEVCTHPLEELTAHDGGLISCSCGIILDKGRYPYVERK